MNISGQLQLPVGHTGASSAGQRQSVTGTLLQVCGGYALSLFRYDELERLVCGLPHLDFEALKAAARYEAGYHATHPTIQVRPSGTASLAAESGQSVTASKQLPRAAKLPSAMHPCRPTCRTLAQYTAPLVHEWSWSTCFMSLLGA